jgi:hypothetical protein
MSSSTIDVKLVMWYSNVVLILGYIPFTHSESSISNAIMSIALALWAKLQLRDNVIIVLIHRYLIVLHPILNVPALVNVV